MILLPTLRVFLFLILQDKPKQMSLRFSQRVGIKPQKEIQRASMDDELKNRLWNILDVFIFPAIKEYAYYANSSTPIVNFRTSFYHNFLKKPLDRAPENKEIFIAEIRIFYFASSWYEVYDLVEFILTEVSDPFYDIDVNNVADIVNSILEKEFSAYRLINNVFAPITNESEIAAISEATQTASEYTALAGCNIHLTAALSLISDRKAPDYRNSIKESISAIEAMVKVISNKPKSTLADSLDQIKVKLNLHPALQKGFKQLYGYTSDSGGIRHALMDQSTNDFEEAKYMLVTCSAFINYLIGKCTKAGIIFK